MQTMLPVGILASGTPTGGGSGFENLCYHLPPNKIKFVGSNHEFGGVRQKADRLRVPFELICPPFDAATYQALLEKYDVELIALSGWLWPVRGLDPQKVINIHPGYLRGRLEKDGPHYGGHGMYGHHVHEAVMADILAGKIPPYSAVTMHFVTEEYDLGPIIARELVRVDPDWTTDQLAAAVNIVEHVLQPIVTALFMQVSICWDGNDPRSVVVPDYIPMRKMPGA